MPRAAPGSDQRDPTDWFTSTNPSPVLDEPEPGQPPARRAGPGAAGTAAQPAYGQPGPGYNAGPAGFQPQPRPGFDGNYGGPGQPGPDPRYGAGPGYGANAATGYHPPYGYDHQPGFDARYRLDTQPGFDPQYGYDPQRGYPPPPAAMPGPQGGPAPLSGPGPQIGPGPAGGYAAPAQPGFGPAGYPDGGYPPYDQYPPPPPGTGSFPGPGQLAGPPPGQYPGPQQDGFPPATWNQPPVGPGPVAGYAPQPGFAPPTSTGAQYGYPPPNAGFAPQQGYPPPDGYQQPGNFGPPPGFPPPQAFPPGQAGRFPGGPPAPGDFQFPPGPPYPPEPQFPPADVTTVDGQRVYLAPEATGQQRADFAPGYGPAAPGWPGTAGQPGHPADGGPRPVTDEFAWLSARTPAPGAGPGPGSAGWPAAPGSAGPAGAPRPRPDRQGGRRNTALIAGAAVLAVAAIAAVIVTPRLLGSTDPGCKAYSGTTLTAYNKTIAELNDRAKDPTQATLSQDMATTITDLTQAIDQANSASVKSALSGLLAQLQHVQSDVGKGAVPGSTVSALNAASLTADNAC